MSLESGVYRTALIWAAVCGLDIVATELIDLGESNGRAVEDIVWATHAEGRTALHMAASSGNVGVMKVLLNRLRDNLLRTR